MAKASGQWLLTASLVSVLVGSSAGLAQTGRAWVDPPPEAGKQASTPATPAAPPPAPAPTPLTPQQQSSTPPAAGASEAKASAQAPAPADASPRKSASDERPKPKMTAERKTQAPSRQASSSARKVKRDEQIVRRRDIDPDLPGMVTGSVTERRSTRITRFGADPDKGSGLQLMRLRTIQLPDGRRIEVLTRPDQAITSEMVDGY